MSQLIYAILALLMIMFLSMNMQRGIGRDQQDQSVNEVATQLTGVGTEVLEHIGSRYFDAYTFTERNNRPYCGRIADDQEYLLSHPDATTAGSTHGDCNALANPYDDCPYIEGFEGITTTITRGEFDYNVTIRDVEYVRPWDFSQVIDSTLVPPDTVTSFAKRVRIRVENPFLYIGDDPTNTFRLDVERVFTYSCLTEPNLIPYVLASETCPANPCATWY